MQIRLWHWLKVAVTHKPQDRFAWGILLFFLFQIAVWATFYAITREWVFLFDVAIPVFALIVVRNISYRTYLIREETRRLREETRRREVERWRKVERWRSTRDSITEYESMRLIVAKSPTMTQEELAQAWAEHDALYYGHQSL